MEPAGMYFLHKRLVRNSVRVKATYKQKSYVREKHITDFSEFMNKFRPKGLFISYFNRGPDLKQSWARLLRRKHNPYHTLGDSMGPPLKVGVGGLLC